MKNSILFAFIVLLLGCTNNPSSMPVLRISPENAIKFDIRADSIQKKVIKIETNDDCLVGAIRGLFLTDSIVGFYSNNNAHMFSTVDGTHFCSIVNKGNGPNEYLNISYLTYSEEEQAFILIDNNFRKKIVFNLLGQPLLEERTEYAITSLNLLSYGEVICRERVDVANNNGHIINVIKKNKPKEGYIRFHYDSGETIWEHQSPVTILTDETFFYQSFFNDTLYYYDGKSLYPRYIVDYNNKSIPKWLKQKQSGEIVEYLLTHPDESYAAFHKVLFTKNDKTFLTYGFNNDLNLCICDTLSLKCESYKNFYIEDFNLVSIAEKWLYLSPYFVLVLDPSRFTDMDKSDTDTIKKYYRELYDILMESSIGDNPILLLIEIN